MKAVWLVWLSAFFLMTSAIGISISIAKVFVFHDVAVWTLVLFGFNIFNIIVWPLNLYIYVDEWNAEKILKEMGIPHD